MSAPSGLAAAAGDATVALSWTRSSSIGVLGYYVYRNGSRIAKSSTSTYADSGLANGTTYRYYVRAYSLLGTSAASNAVSATPSAPPPALIAPPVNTTLPGIAGTPLVGQLLAASLGSWSGNPTSYAHQWNRCGLLGTGCTPIAGATGSSYSAATLDVGSTLEVTVTATNAGGSTTATSSPTLLVQALTTLLPPTNSAVPTISGNPVAGQTLTTSAGVWNNSPSSLGYQWLRCDANGANCAAVAGATASSYPLGSGDVGYRIAVTVTASNAAGSASATSPATAAVTAAVSQLFISPSGNDSNPCTQSQPCLTMDRAYHLASPGQVVIVAGGIYNAPFTDAANSTVQGEQITWDASKAGAGSDVIFEPAAGATVFVAGHLRVYSSHVEFRNMTLGSPGSATPSGTVEAYNYDPVGNYAGNDVGNIVFRNIVARNFNLFSVHDVTVSGGSYGPSSDCGSAQPSLPQYGSDSNSLREEAGAPNDDKITIQGVTIHNVMSYDINNCHTEGLAVFGATNVTITQSKFYGNDVYDLFLQSNSGPVNGITITNNWFAAPTGQAGTGTGSETVGFSGSTSDFANTLFANNSLNGSVGFDENGVNPSYANFRVVGNIGQMPYSGYCPPALAAGGAFAYNVWQNSGCGTGDADLGGGAMPYVNGSNDSTLDYHLSGGVANDLVPVSLDGLKIDIDGNLRPVAGETFIDAGASETP